MQERINEFLSRAFYALNRNGKDVFVGIIAHIITVLNKIRTITAVIFNDLGNFSNMYVSKVSLRHNIYETVFIHSHISVKPSSIDKLGDQSKTVLAFETSRIDMGTSVG
jgi:hypothetical protein